MISGFFIPEKEGCEHVRDESAADLRLILEPKSRNVEAAMLMETLYRQTELEVRVPLNMNVLDAAGTPRIMTLREVLQSFLDHRHEVLLRRSRYRLEKIALRLEVLEGYLAVYAHLDEVIRIIRKEDEPKPVMMKRWKLTDRQAEAILEMRLRSLRKLDEIAVRNEHAALSTEQKDLRSLLKDSDKRWKAIAGEIADIKKRFGGTSALGRRRTKIGEPPAAIEVPIEAVIAREPITVVCSQKGWIRAAKGHLGPDADLRYKEGDEARFVFPAWSTDKLLLFGTDGRFYTLGADKLPAARGHGEPVRLMVDLGNDRDIVALFVHKPGRKLVVAARDGRGFVVAEDDVLAQTRAGKQVLNVGEGVEAAACAEASGDHLAVMGENRKLIVFPLAELPEMSRGRGVILQKYKDGGLSDVRAFNLADGLTWTIGDRTRTETDLRPWIGKRAQAGRLPPQGFPKTNRF